MKYILSGLLMFLFSGILLAQDGVNFYPKAMVKEISKYAQISKDDICEMNILVEGQPQGKFFLLKDKVNLPYRFIYVGRVNSCRTGGCSGKSCSVEAQSEYFDYFILYDKTATVKRVKIFNYQATHGQEVTATGWLKQFDNYNGSTSLEIGRSIDAISGATISAQNITTDIQQKTCLLLKKIPTLNQYQ